MYGTGTDKPHNTMGLPHDIMGYGTKNQKNNVDQNQATLMTLFEFRL